MTKNIDTIYIVDLECTCWTNDAEKGSNRSEIIEVGICEYHYRDNVIDRPYSLYVTNTISPISQFCTKLTGITQELLNREGRSFPNVIDTLINRFKTKNAVWASYGDFDREMFGRQLDYPEFKDLPYPFSKTHINVKNLVAYRKGFYSEVGMAKALEALNIPLEGRHHSGKDDSYNIAKILQWCLKS